MKILILSVSAFFLTSCTTVNFSKTGILEAKSKNVGCEFSIYTTQPNQEFDELGVVEFGGYSFWSGKACPGPNSVADAKEKSAEYVCKAGGNALLLWEANAFGCYLKATVVNIQSH